MEFPYMLQILVAAIDATRMTFELETRFNDRALPQELALAPNFTSDIHVCAGHCVSNPNCSILGFNEETSACQLFGNVISSSGSKVPDLFGARYYAYTEDWCPFRRYYYLFRALNLCVKIHRSEKNYQTAKSLCEERGAQLMVLDDEKKAATVLDVVKHSGLTTTNIFVGAEYNETKGWIVWSDGRNITNDLWRPGEPNNSGGSEECTVLIQGGLNDISCGHGFKFLCEIHPIPEQ